MTVEEYIEKLNDPTLIEWEDKGDGNVVLIRRLIFHYTIIETEIGDFDQYLDRWCYPTLDGALMALQNWKDKGFEGEPQGWNRHPQSGRRRDPQGNETIAP